jgi:glycosyltransferase involved in cell wall biosynthesis
MSNHKRSDHRNKVTAIVLTYNHENYIGDCIRSIQAQNFPDLEILVLDDKSTDRTADVVRDICASSRHVNLIVNQQNSGNPAVNTQKLIDASASDYILFMSGDDLLAEDYSLHRIVTHLDTEPRADVVIPKLRYLLSGQAPPPPEIYDRNLLEGLRSSNPATLCRLHLYRRVSRIFVQGCVIRRQTIEDMGGFDSGMIADDYAFVLRLLDHLRDRGNRFFFDENSSWLYRLHANNIHRNPMRQFRSIIEVVSGLVPERYWQNFAWDGVVFVDHEDLLQADRLSRTCLGNRNARGLIDTTDRLAIRKARRRGDRTFLQTFATCREHPWFLRLRARLAIARLYLKPGAGTSPPN